MISILYANSIDRERYRYLLVGVECYSNWPLARAFKNPSAENMSTFIYEDICSCGQQILDVNLVEMQSTPSRRHGPVLAVQ